MLKDKKKSISAVWSIDLMGKSWRKDEAGRRDISAAAEEWALQACIWFEYWNGGIAWLEDVNRLGSVFGAALGLCGSHRPPDLHLLSFVLFALSTPSYGPAPA